MDPMIPSTCVRMPIALLKFVGMWLPNEQLQSRSTRLQYRVYSFIIKFWFIYIYTFSEVVQLFCITDMEVFSSFSRKYHHFSVPKFLQGLTDALFLLMTNLALMYKVTNYFRQHKRIRDLVTCIDDKVFRPETDQEAR